MPQFHHQSSGQHSNTTASSAFDPYVSRAVCPPERQQDLIAAGISLDILFKSPVEELQITGLADLLKEELQQLEQRWQGLHTQMVSCLSSVVSCRCWCGGRPPNDSRWQ